VVRVGGSPDDGFYVYWLTRALQKACQLLYKFTRSRFIPADLLIGRCTPLLIKAAKRRRADLYIAHNLAALPAAVKAAKKHHTKIGFDAEDFHRNETSNDINSPDVKLKSAIENKYIPLVDYISVSSPGIGDAYRQLFPAKKPVVILNAFPVDNAITIKDNLLTGPLKLFWFSQTIGPQRGLEDAIKALKALNNDKIELHLLGDLTPWANSYLAGIGAGNITLYVHPPISPARINEFASQFDVGLALEPAFCLNNDLALSNKIFTYLQAGLAIVASDTTAQRGLLEQYPKIGGLYKKGDEQALADLIKYYFDNRSGLLLAKKESRRVACGELNWEKESLVFLNNIQNLFNCTVC
jgi:glycosyltransferase involved in cell wall biosynthesis